MENTNAFFAKPDVLKAEHILAIQPHYDDNDIAAGGTLSKLAKNGTKITYLTISDDLIGVIDENWSKEEATKHLRSDQEKAAELIGVSDQYWLGYPDAGKYDYYELREDIIRVIRQTRPDFIFTVDPWLPYEGHQDHILGGRAASEAAMLYGLMRLKTDPATDENYVFQELKGIAYYCSAWPNTFFDISETFETKLQTMDCYKAQFDSKGLEELKMTVGFMAQHYAENQSFQYAEPLKIIKPDWLHMNIETWKL
jgi:LmbE family N-acetylglucosaminyl deacetylase